jgi:hypothetical protein
MKVDFGYETARPQYLASNKEQPSWVLQLPIDAEAWYCDAHLTIWLVIAVRRATVQGPFTTTTNMTWASIVPDGGKPVKVMKHNIFAGPVSAFWVGWASCGWVTSPCGSALTLTPSRHLGNYLPTLETSSCARIDLVARNQ